MHILSSHKNNNIFVPELFCKHRISLQNIAKVQASQYHPNPAWKNVQCCDLTEKPIFQEVIILERFWLHYANECCTLKGERVGDEVEGEIQEGGTTGPSPW